MKKAWAGGGDFEMQQMVQDVQEVFSSPESTVHPFLQFIDWVWASFSGPIVSFAVLCFMVGFAVVFKQMVLRRFNITFKVENKKKHGGEDA